MLRTILLVMYLVVVFGRKFNIDFPKFLQFRISRNPVNRLRVYYKQNRRIDPRRITLLPHLSALVHRASSQRWRATGARDFAEIFRECHANGNARLENAVKRFMIAWRKRREKNEKERHGFFSLLPLRASVRLCV